MLGARSGGPVVYGYAKFRSLEREGFRSIAKRCMEITFYAKDKLEDEDFNLFVKSQLNVLAVKVENLDRVVKNYMKEGGA